MGRRGRPPYTDVLTPREFEVLELIRGGLSNDEIADRLGISLAGAKYHVSEILGKLGVASREEAAAWSASGGRPWWAAAFAPLVWFRHAGFSQLAAGATAIVVAAGIGLLVWGLVRTNGDEERLLAAQTATPATATRTPSRTATILASPIATPTPTNVIEPPPAQSSPTDASTPTDVPTPPSITTPGLSRFRFCIGSYDPDTLEPGPDRITNISLDPLPPGSSVSMTKLGCAQFENVPAGSYSISYETARGFSGTTDPYNLQLGEDGQINYGIGPPLP